VDVEPSYVVHRRSFVQTSGVVEPPPRMITLSGVCLSPLSSKELLQLRDVHVSVPSIPLFHAPPKKAYCDSGFRLNTLEPDSGQELIEKGMTFDSMEDLKFFLRDYSVCHHRPYDVVHSSANLWYTLSCQLGCGWKVSARPIINVRERWRITKVKQPHTCGTSRPSEFHSQCTARYIGGRIAAMVHVDPQHFCVRSR
jgi:hypothetical protein